MLTHHSALISCMVLVAGSDRVMDDSELKMIGNLVKQLPIFRDYDIDRLPDDARSCNTILQEENGLQKALAAIAEALPGRLRENAYVVACDVAAANGVVADTEARMLELLRQHLRLGRLVSAAIERAARARHITLDTN
ncbi:MAG: tellurite resistance TerB family protein [Rhodospirillales bacterium]